jgi:hypothetical protein
VSHKRQLSFNSVDFNFFGRVPAIPFQPFVYYSGGGGCTKAEEREREGERGREREREEGKKL